MKFFVQLVVLMSLMLLSGCGTTHVQKHVPQTQSHGHGLVFVHFPRTMPDSIWIKSLNDDEHFFLLENNLHRATAQLWVPPGQYQLYSIKHGKGGVLLDGYPEFTVESNKITNLGGLSDFNVGNNQQIWLPKSVRHSEQLIQNLQNKLGSFLTKKEIIHWQVNEVPQPQEWITARSGPELIPYLRKRSSDNTAKGETRHDLLKLKDVDQFFAVAVQTLPPLPEQTPAVDDQNNLYFGADYGIIKKRNTDGRWSNVDTGLGQSIGAIAWMDNVLFVAGKYGTVVLSKDQGKTWQEVATLPSGERIFDITVDNSNFLVLATRAKDNASEVILYESAFSEKPTFKQHSVFTSSIPVDAYPFGQLVEKRYYMGLRYVGDSNDKEPFSSNKSYYFDTQSLKFEGPVLPRVYSHFSVSSNGLLTAFYNSGILSELIYSVDGGEHWIDQPVPTTPLDHVIFHTQSQGTATSFRPDAANDKASKVFTYNSTNGWQHLTDIPRQCKQMLEGADHAIRFCVTVSNKILSLDDKGWKYERYQ